MALANKTVLVTGGGSGMGLAIALGLAAEGCRVAITGRRAGLLAEAAAQHKGSSPILHRPSDVSDRAQVAELFAWLRDALGPLDILVNSAGVNVRRRSMAELSPDDWERMMDINASGAYYCMREALVDMRERRSGLIVNISSVSGKRAYKLAGPAYCASKFAFAGLAMAVALEEREQGIRVTNVYPGEVNTPILAERPTPVPPERLAAMLQPDDVASMVVALAKLPDRVVVPELVITPLYQEYA